MPIPTEGVPPMGMDPSQQPPPGMLPGAPPPPDGGPPLSASMPDVPPAEPDFSRLDDEALVRDIELSEDEEARIKKLVRAELDRSLRLLSDRNKRIREFRQQYREKKKAKLTPNRQASNLCVPMSGPDTDQVSARTNRVLNVTEPLYVIEPGGDQDSDLGQLLEVQKYFQAKMQDPQMRYAQSREEFVHEICEVGVCIGKVLWDIQSRTVCRYEVAADEKPGEDGVLRGTPQVIASDEVTYEGNRFEPVKYEDFYYDASEQRNPNLIQDSWWVAHRFMETTSEMERKARMGIYDKDAVEKIKKEEIRDTPGDRFSSLVDMELLEQMEASEKPAEATGNRSTNYEVHIRLSLKDKKKGKQQEKDCVFVYNFAGDVFLSKKYLYLFHGKRPFVRGVFGEIGEFGGKGVPERLNHVQRAANDVLNVGLDAGIFGVLPMFKKKKSSIVSRGKQDEYTFGKVWELDEIGDLEPLQVGDTSGAFLQHIEMLRTIGQKASGVTDFLAGMEGAQGNRESAAGAGQRTGNSSPIFDDLLNCVRRALEEAGEMFWSNLRQFRPDGDTYLEQGATGYVSKVFKMPMGDSKYLFRIHCSSVAANPEVRKQTVQHLMGLLAPAEQQMMQLIQQICDPQTPPMMREFLIQSGRRQTLQLRQIADSFELPGAAKLVPDFEEIWTKNEQQVMQQIQAAQGQPAPMGETLARALAPDWPIMEPECQADFYKRNGFPVPPNLQRDIILRKQQIQIPPDPEQQQQQQGGQDGGDQGPGDPMGGAEQGGEGGPSQPPPGM